MENCIIDGCSKPKRRIAADWCEKHYIRWYRHGDPEFIKPKSFQDLAGKQYGALTVLERDMQSKYTSWICLCSCGVTKSIRAYSLTTTHTLSCGDQKNHSRRDTQGSYNAVHLRLKIDKGTASSYACLDCPEPAYHWSYDHLDPDELWSQERDYMVPYSRKPEHYQALCVRCHKKRDLTERYKPWHEVANGFNKHK